jgi:glycine/D-amino acid oxidase-like deaminating enzyme
LGDSSLSNAASALGLLPSLPMVIQFLLVGQGLAGSLLGYELLRRGYSIRIVDPVVEDTSSNVAAGLYNPITGREMKKTWMADVLFAGLEGFYLNLERKLGARFIQTTPIYRPFRDMAEQNDWQTKSSESMYQPFVRTILSSSLGIQHLHDPFGGLVLRPSGAVDTGELVRALRGYFVERGVFIQSNYPDEDPHHYEGMAFERVIFCNGVYARESPFWRAIPFRPVRGEVMDVRLELPGDYIYNRGVFLLPREGFFKLGSTYMHHPLTFEPQPKGLDELHRRLAGLYTGPVEMLSARAGVRPATYDRRPFIGWHPENKAVGIFNGFGAKGVSLVPYFSNLFVDQIEAKANIHPEADVRRVF